MKTPINKGGDTPPPRLPQINNRATIAILNAADHLTKRVRSRLHRPAASEAESHFNAALMRALTWSPQSREQVEQVGIRAEVSIGRSFGKPTLIAVDLIATHPQAADGSATFSALLTKTARVMWDNPEITPAAIRARVIDEEHQPLADLTSIGFPDEMARPEDLYEHFGPPKGDPQWRP